MARGTLVAENIQAGSSSDLSSAPEDTIETKQLSTSTRKRKNNISPAESACKRARKAPARFDSTGKGPTVPLTTRKRRKANIVVKEEVGEVVEVGKEETVVVVAEEREVVVETVVEGAKAGVTSGTDGLNQLKRSRRKKVVKEEVEYCSEVSLDREAATPQKRRKKKGKEGGCEVKIEGAINEQVTTEDPVNTKRRKKSKEGGEEVKLDEEEDKQVDEKADTEKLAKPKRKRKTKEEKEAEAMPLAARTAATKLWLGAHVSAAGGVHNSVTNCVHIGGNAFALFLKSQRKWENPDLKPEHITLFHSYCQTHTYPPTTHIVPHGSYLVNLAQPEPEKAMQAYNAFLDDLKRCESLGIRLYNFHPGNTAGAPRGEAITRIAAQLNRAHRATSTVVTLLENMAASTSGNVIGGSFEDLRDVIELVEDKSRVAVCLDTCHAFAAGYDLRAPEAFQATLRAFDDTVGARYLRAVHLNDSKAPFASHRDLHQNIGLGFLGLRAFHNLVNEPRFHGMPIVLETPIDRKDENGKDVEDEGVWAREIKMLEGLAGMDAEGEEFRALEEKLAKDGEEERRKYQDAFDRKVQKDAKAKVRTKVKEKGQVKLSFAKETEVTVGGLSELSELDSNA